MATFSKGDTSQTVDIYLKDNTSTSGDMPLPGLEYDTPGLTMLYIRQGESGYTDISPMTSGTPGSYVSRAFCEIKQASGQGVYQYGVPNAVLADDASVDYATFIVYGAANLTQHVERFDLLDPVVIGTDQRIYLSSDTGTIPSVPANELSDFIIRRHISGARETSAVGVDAVSARSFLGAISRLVNKVERIEESGKIYIYEEDDSTEFFDQTFTKEPTGLHPLLSVDTN